MSKTHAELAAERHAILYPPTRQLILGLDLGQQQDFTALAIAERTPPGAPDPATWAVPHLERWPLGTPYTAIVQAVAGRTRSLMAIRPPLDVTVVIDATGVGRPVLDMFVEGALGLAPIAVTITGGDRVIRNGRDASVPKRDLVSVLAVLLQSNRMQVAAALPLAPVLVAELQNLRAKISPSGHARFEAGPADPTDQWRMGAHDDLVLATALALWFGEHGQINQRVGIADSETAERYHRMVGAW